MQMIAEEFERINFVSVEVERLDLPGGYLLPVDRQVCELLNDRDAVHATVKGKFTDIIIVISLTIANITHSDSYKLN